MTTAAAAPELHSAESGERGLKTDASIDVAQEVGADTIVVQTVGENPISGALLGPVALRLVLRSHIPVLVVPTAEA